MRLTLCLEGNGEGRVLASIDMEEIIAHTNIKDIIRREIHDNVAQEMYCKGIDDLTEKLKDYFVIPHDARVIEMTAEQLKAKNNERKGVREK